MRDLVPAAEPSPAGRSLSVTGQASGDISHPGLLPGVDQFLSLTAASNSAAACLAGGRRRGRVAVHPRRYSRAVVQEVQLSRQALASVTPASRARSVNSVLTQSR